VNTPVTDSSGSLCTSEKDLLHRWAEHYHSVLNYLPAVSDPDLHVHALSTAVDTSVNDDAPTLAEDRADVKQLKNGRAAGNDGIPLELLKCTIEPVSIALHRLFLLVWKTGKVPSDWRDSITVSLSKGKGQKTECSNYHP